MSTPIFLAHDLDVSAGFYERLGFRVDRLEPSYAIVVASGTEVLHLEATDAPSTSNTVSAYLNVPDVDHLHATWCDGGVDVGDLADRPWGMREFRVDDPSGNTLRVGTNLEARGR